MPPKYSGRNVTIPYSFDWTDWLAGESILSSTWKIEPSDRSLSIKSTYLRNSSTSTVVYLSGGKAGTDYCLTNNVVTQSRSDKRTMVIPVR